MVHSEEYLQKRRERKLKFSNQKKKNRVFKARRNNNVKKSFQTQAPKNSTQLRTRGLFKVLPTDDFEMIPQCSHGPCLLFEKRTAENRTETFFACAIYRNKEESCDFKIKYNRKTGRIQKIIPKEAETKTKAIEYGAIPKALANMKADDLVLYCKDCVKVFANKHECVCAPIEREILKFPTKLLPALNDQNGESQFFFSEESLNVLIETIQRSNIDGILCIAAPRVFETVLDKVSGLKGFMLDYDKRFGHFYGDDQYAQYSMLVDHFYDTKAESKLVKFLKKCKKVLVVCDPPFGLFMDPLLKSMEKIKKRFCDTGKSAADFYTIYVLPLFFRKYVLHGRFWMSDYRVTYDNHKQYNNPEKSIVRLFTDLPKKTIDLKRLDGYKFCEICDSWVTKNNVHCSICNNCTSIENHPYKHCNQCLKCVKSTYYHCSDCKRCHLIGRCVSSIRSV